MGKLMSISRFCHRSAALGLIGLLCSPLAAASYLDHPKAKAFIDEVVAEGTFKKDELEALLGSAERKDGILEAIARPAEKPRPGPNTAPSS